MMTNENYSFCPLKNNNIYEGECYDVQMVRSRLILENVLSFVVDREKANILCDKCSFNQLNGSPKPIKPMKETQLACAV